jgi:hypothetical protein
MFRLCRQLAAITSLAAMLLTHLVGIVHVGCHSLSMGRETSHPTLFSVNERLDVNETSKLQLEAVAANGNACCSCNCSPKRTSHRSAVEHTPVREGEKPDDHDADACVICKVYYASDAISLKFVEVSGPPVTSPDSPSLTASQGYVAPAISLHSGRGPPALG